MWTFWYPCSSLSKRSSKVITLQFLFLNDCLIIKCAKNRLYRFQRNAHCSDDLDEPITVGYWFFITIKRDKWDLTHFDAYKIDTWTANLNEKPVITLHQSQCILTAIWTILQFINVYSREIRLSLTTMISVYSEHTLIKYETIQ